MGSEVTPETTPRRGRPRSERSKRAILQAAAALMLERDLGEISMDAIAGQAGASKATIYRWWPSKELLVLEALRSEWEIAIRENTDTGSLAGDLCALIVPWTRELAARPYGRVIAAFIARAQVDAEFAREYRAKFVELRRKPARSAFKRAISRGEIAASTDVEAALDLLYGPFYHRTLQGHAAVTETFTRTIVDYVLAALSAPAREGR
jgi:AcrR family transcriptional regulator